MRDYIITVNSTVDTGKEWLEERNGAGDSTEIYNRWTGVYRYVWTVSQRIFPEAERG